MVTFLRKLVTFFVQKSCVYEKKAVSLQLISSGSVHMCVHIFCNFVLILNCIRQIRTYATTFLEIT